MSQHAIPIQVPQEAPFLRNNWKKVLSDAEEHLAKIRCLRGVATITNGRMMVRTRLPVPDGFYTITRNGQFRPVPRSVLTGMRGGTYPDPDQFMPPFETLKPFCEIPQDAVRHMIDFAESGVVMSQDLCLTKEGIYLLDNPKHPHFRFPLNLPAEVIVSASQLKLALIEMMRYDSIYLFRENWEQYTPLVLGHNWESCALVSVPRIFQG